MTGMHQGGPGHEHGPRDLLDAYFDGEIDRAGRARLHEALREDALLAEEFSRTSEAVSMLRQSAANSGLDVDLTERVLAQSEIQRRYLNKRGRRFVLAGRSAVAMAALAMVAGVVVWVRLTPPELRLSERERPLGTLLESGNADAASLRLVPPDVQQDLSDSVDQSKAEHRIVFYNLQAEPADAFSAFAQDAARARAMQDAGPMARLPLLADAHDVERQRELALRQGPMPMGEQSAASVVARSQATGWWGRRADSPLLQTEIVQTPGGAWLLVRRAPAKSPDAERDEE